MKKILLVTLGVATLLGGAGCKKGSEDPLISIRTRTNRLVDDWFVNSGTVTVNTSYPGYSNVTTSSMDYDVLINSSDGNSSVWNGSTNYSFQNDGSVHMNSSYTNTGNTTLTFSGSKTGTWAWMEATDGDGTGGVGGDDGFKNKERVAVTYTYESNSSNLGFTDANINEVYEYELVQLKKRDMRMVYTYRYENGDTLIVETGDLFLRSSHKYEAPQ